jgi:hypothetical protein
VTCRREQSLQARSARPPRTISRPSLTIKEANSISVSATYTAGGGGKGPTIAVSGPGSLSTDFMKVLGLPNEGFSANSITS